MVSYCWRRLPAGARAFIVPAGLTVSALAYLSRAATHAAAAMSGTAAWLAVLPAAALPAALIMVRGISRRPGNVKVTVDLTK